jgi:prolyl-tRNA editing enzyme YbaK/EbsC (Cys-tRNA(Pro) deacylase)
MKRLLKPILGEKMIKADADFTRQMTGFAIGRIPPVAHKEPIDLIFIDEDLLALMRNEWVR